MVREIKTGARQQAAASREARKKCQKKKPNPRQRVEKQTATNKETGVQGREQHVDGWESPRGNGGSNAKNYLCLKPMILISWCGGIWGTKNDGGKGGTRKRAEKDVAQGRGGKSALQQVGKGGKDQEPRQGGRRKSGTKTYSTNYFWGRGGGKKIQKTDFGADANAERPRTPNAGKKKTFKKRRGGGGSLTTGQTKRITL